MMGKIASNHKLERVLRLFGSGLIICVFIHAREVQGQVTKQGASNDSSHVIIMAIKSVSGEIPDNEFFAATWRIKYLKEVYTLANVDIALSESDTVESNRELTEAGLLLNIDISKLVNAPSKDSLFRSVFVAPTIKIFNAEAYYGISLGSIELRNSDFYSTYFYLGYLRRFFPLSVDNKIKDNRVKLANDNLYAEFLIHSNKMAFFKSLAFKGGVLVPLLRSEGDFNDIQFRITIAVPVGGVFSF